MVRELKHIISNGALGEIQKIHLEMPQEGFKRPPDIAGKPSQPQSWRLKDYDVPTICLDLGVHLHHLSSYLLEVEPEATCAQFANHSEFKGLVDDVNMLLKYPNGIVGSMWMSKTAIGHRNGLSVRVYGTKGSARWFQLNPDELELNYNDGRREVLDRAGQCQYANQFRYNRMKPGHPTGFVEAFANLYSDIAGALQLHLSKQPSRSEYVFGFEQAKQGLALFEAAKRSAESGTWQQVK
ncbi:Gfo/Idh/MocA family oxidoreductase [Pseudoalteromonas sp. XMcav11-Q]